MSFKSNLTENSRTETIKRYNKPESTVPYRTKYRKCTIPNYIPHKTPRNINGERWHNSYNKYLIEMFQICQNIINEELPKNNINYSNKTFNVFSYMIYQSSSKYISPYLDDD